MKGTAWPGTDAKVQTAWYALAAFSPARSFQQEVIVSALRGDAFFSCSVRRFATSHRRTVVSWLLEAKIVPSGLNASPVTAARWPAKSWTRVACAMSCASFRYHTLELFFAGRENMPFQHLVRSHNFTIWSSPADANVLPSGLNATDRTVS